MSRLQTWARYEMPDDDASDNYADYLICKYTPEELIDDADLLELVNEDNSNIEDIADQAVNKLCAEHFEGKDE